ncbi:hypothetical protein HWV62_25675 [Athelia sp. TMB]|nr:hypothetical protein HWV62_25675 [Athelia sp. TMB]
MYRTSRKCTAANFEWYAPADGQASQSEDGPPPTVRLQHADFTTNDAAGPSSIHNSYVTAPASPPKPTATAPVYQQDYLLYQMGIGADVDYQMAAGTGEDQDEGAAEDAIDPQYQHHLEERSLGEPKSRQKRIQNNPLRTWLDEREDFLLELLRRDGRGDSGHRCSCNKADGVVRCTDCYGSVMVCQSCIVETHHVNPFHRIEIWRENHFEKTTLKDMGLTLQLGHPLGTHCINPKPAAGESFIVLDINGIHNVTLAFCGCATALADTTQLLRAGLYPATTLAPETAATINALEYFHILTFESKTSAFEFHNTLARLTDNTGTEAVPDRYEELLRMIRQWKNLKMLKRAGRGHDPAGVAATKEGECAVLCPACPQPGKNLVADWQKAPEAIQYLFALFLGNDANFRMVRKKVSSEEADPTLSAGWSYFCEMTKYRQHLAKYGDQKEVHSTCVKHHAVGDANTGRFANLAASGIGTIDCARHMMKRPNSLGDLQQGEKYANMDYMFFSSLAHPHDTLSNPPPADSAQTTPSPDMPMTPPPQCPPPPLTNTNAEDYVTVVVSYDIVCQWSVHIWERMLQFPEHLRIDREGKRFLFLIPKFHLPAHISKCQTSYSFNFTPGVGRTDGEAPERGWSFIDPLSTSTKEMGPASYRETIDDHFGDFNHKKVIGLGRLIQRRLTIAIPGRDDHVVDYNAFTFSLPAASIIEWSTWVETWEKAPDGPNPFVPTTKKVTQHDVRLALAKEDAASITADEVSSVHDDITPGMFIAQGLEIESQQRRLKIEKKALGALATPLQLTKIQERQNSLLRKIKAWMVVQLLYMPEVSPLRAAADRAASAQSAATESFDIALYLPSALPSRIRVKAILYDYEFRLRRAQAYEALDDLRGHLRLRTHMWTFKDRNVRGQSACTRSNNLLTRVQKNVNSTAAQYRAARAALVSLSARTGDYGWQGSLRELADADIRAFTDDADGETQAQKRKREKKNKGGALGEGRKKLSWIWMIVGVAANGEDQGLQEGAPACSMSFVTQY